VNEPDWVILSSLGAFELQERLIEWVNDLVRDLDENETNTVVAGLPAPLRVAWLLSWLDTEVIMGGFPGYFFNQGRHAGLAAEALIEIGAPAMASVLQEANRSVQIHEDAWEAHRAEVYDAGEFAIVSGYGDIPTDELSRLTKAFWEGADGAEFRQRLDEYLRRSTRELAAPPPGG
jgi:hypothetical protein